MTGRYEKGLTQPADNGPIVIDDPRRIARAETGRRKTVNILLWVLQGLTALLYGASGIMKVFMFDKISADVRSFGALPREIWMALGILELICMAGLIVPAALRWHPMLTVLAPRSWPSRASCSSACT